MVPSAALDRTRATFWDVVRATEVHRYKVVLIENVVEAASWELFDVWLSAMTTLGYSHQFISVSSAHVGDDTNPHAPQWRDRLYIVFTSVDVPMPDIRPRPLAWCAHCGQISPAVQSWKRLDRRRVGKYRQQYVYRCPNSGCRHAIVEPFVRPAADAIDWSDLGERIGDRGKPLAAATLRRIRAGLDQYAHPATTAGAGLASPPMMVPAGGTWNDDATTVAEPMRTRLTRDTEGLLTPQPWITVLRNHAAATSISDPLATVATGGGGGGGHQALTVPPGAFIHKHHGGLDYKAIAHMTKSVDEPLPGIVARPNLSLVIPYRKGKAKTTDEPLHTVATRDSAALVAADAIEIDDCRFRMLKPREHGRAQRFCDDYRVIGNISEQTMGFGNAVSANVAQWLGGIVAEVLGGAA